MTAFIVFRFVMSVCIGIILIQHDNDNEKLDFFVTKSAVDSLVET